jgi:lipid-A-disaccharide synthase
MPIFHEVREALKDVNASILIPDYFTQEEIETLYGDLSNFERKSDAHKTLYEADFAFICSGTATLEAALIGTPFILSYIAKPLDYFVATKFIKIEYVGLSNIMFQKMNGSTMHPEFIQDSVTSQNLLENYNHYNRENFLSDSKRLREYLVRGSSKQVAKFFLK